MAVALPAWKASVLSLAQQNVIAKKTAKMSKAEKEILAEMSDAGELAEFFCSPAALAGSLLATYGGQAIGWHQPGQSAGFIGAVVVRVADRHRRRGGDPRIARGARPPA